MATDTKTEQRIAALEQQNQELKSELAALRAPKPASPQPAAPVQDGVSVHYSRSPIDMPTPAQYERLITKVQRAYPQHVVQTVDLKDFIAACEFLAHVRRPVDPHGVLVLNKKDDASWWAIEAQRWLGVRGDHADVTNGSFFLAVIATGDIAYQFPDRDRGVRSAYVSLSYREDGVRATAAGWRRVLSDGWEPRSPVMALVEPPAEVSRRATPNQQDLIAARMAERDAYVKRESPVFIVSR
jgi:hypothetical protein